MWPQRCLLSSQVPDPSIEWFNLTPTEFPHPFLMEGVAFSSWIRWPEISVCLISYCNWVFCRRHRMGIRYNDIHNSSFPVLKHFFGQRIWGTDSKRLQLFFYLGYWVEISEDCWRHLWSEYYATKQMIVVRGSAERKSDVDGFEPEKLLCKNDIVHYFAFTVWFQRNARVEKTNHGDNTHHIAGYNELSIWSRKKSQGRALYF